MSPTWSHRKGLWLVNLGFVQSMLGGLIKPSTL